MPILVILAVGSILLVDRAVTEFGAVVTNGRSRRRLRWELGVESAPRRWLDRMGPIIRTRVPEWRRHRLLVGVSRRMDLRRAERSLPGLFDEVIRRMRAGATVPMAMAAAAAIGSAPGDRELAEAIDSGVSLDIALDDWRRAAPTPSRRLAGVALRLAAERGGPVAGVLGGVAESLRDRAALESEVRALSSQARASAVVMVLAPLAFAALAATLDDRIAAFLLADPLGWACIVGGLLLDLLGALWMRRLVGSIR